MTEQEKNRERKNILRLYRCDSIRDSKDMLFILNNCLLRIITEHSKLPVKNRQEQDAKLVCQMVMTKIISVNKLAEGINFKAYDGMTLNNIIDPTTLAVLVRNIYETAAMFNTVYVKTQSVDEKEILYKLWVIAGLKYRQRLATKLTNKENKQKQIDEANDIARMTSEIEQTILYQSLSLKNQELIKRQIKDKDYKVEFSGNVVKSLPWHEIKMDIKDWIIEQIYTFLSLYAHPSNVSVFQFRELFRPEKPTFIDLSNFNLRYVIIMVCVFVADYIDVFPEAKTYFDSLPTTYQFAINYYNQQSRNTNKAINNTLSLLA